MRERGNNLSVGSLGQLTVDLVANTAGFERGMNQAERALKSATKEANYQAAALDKLIGQIDPTVAAYSRLDKMEQQLEAHRKAGRLPTADYEVYIKQLNASREAVAATTKAIDANTRGFNAQGISAKAMAANLRNVPAQFTDIAVSLQAGQAPLTVLLQQGGQLKDMFGGIVPAARALGGYVAGLVTPFTLAAAAALALAVAYKQGSDESTAFNTALAMTGNTAGTSASQLASLAQQVSLSGGTVGKASAVLAQLAASTKIPVSSFEAIAVAAVKFESATGQAAEETVKNFEKIAKDPTAEILKLNESMNFLTATTYEQIKSFQDAGNAQAAATLATKAYEDGLNRTSTAVKANLGSLESAWNSLKSAAKGAWDAALNIGREDTLDQQIGRLKKQLNDIASAKAANNVPGNGIAPDDSFRQEALQRDLTQKLILKSEQDRRAATVGFAQQQKAQALADQVEIDRLRKETESNSDKREREIGNYRLLVERRAKEARVANDKSLLISAADQAKQIAAINEKYKDPATPKGPRAKAYTEDAGQKMLDTLRQQNATLQAQSASVDEQTGKYQTLGAQAQALVKFQQEIADIKAKDVKTTDQQSLLNSAELITAQLKRNVAIEQEVAARKASYESAQKLQALQEAQDNKVDIQQQGYDDQLAGTGQGTKLRQRMKEQLALQKDYANQMSALAKQNAAGNLVGDDYEKAKVIVQEGLAKQLVAQQDYYNQVDKLQGDFFNGTSEAWANYVDEARDYSAQAAEATTGVLNDATSSLASGLDGIVKGTETVGQAFANLGVGIASSILGALEQIAAKWIVTESLQLLGIGTITSATVASEGVKTAAVVSAESTKTAAKVAGDSVSTASTLASIGTTLATNLAAAAETLAAWAPAALVASIGSFGAAAVVGGAALVAAYALIKGFEGGGYTGDGGSSEPAGIVHKGEYVFTKAQTARIGKGKLASIASTGYEAGGFVGPSTAPMLGSNVSTIPTSTRVHNSLTNLNTSSNKGGTTINLVEDASRAGQSQERTGDQGEKMIDVFVADLLGDGRTKDAMSTKFGLRSVGV